ncbi:MULTISPECIES: hypothetical protein [unclassified Burkholderia]|uniref:hypothetical protein n=1 Tax=unclassified Burkholderia TaxID=2613784 RepID=UPI001E37EBA3|nr:MULTISPECIES: hypothetical protein [unclassified Burkholderia]UEP32919.1 hypothetical protein LMA01_31995 [Burkholderia sp. B21-007]UEP46017.1 hypothetical protein LMA02_34320 [Burkholderia sp. B21-005]
MCGSAREGGWGVPLVLVAVLTNWLLDEASVPPQAPPDNAGSNVLPLYRVG